MGELREVSVKLVDGKMHFIGNARECNEIDIDYPPPFGAGDGYTSLEIFLISLASCSGSSVAVLLRKMGKNIVDLRVNASGVRRDQHPTCFEKINLTFTIVSDDADDESVNKALKISEETLCPVWAMIKNNVTIHYKYTLNRTENTVQAA